MEVGDWSVSDRKEIAMDILGQALDPCPSRGDIHIWMG